jgi:anti-sigma B factor antagonist
MESGLPVLVRHRDAVQGHRAKHARIESEGFQVGSDGMGKQFEATEKIVTGVRIVEIRGELDIATSSRVRELLSEAAADDDRPLVVDLRECPFIDSTGLATLLHGTKPAQNGESNVAIVSAGGEVRKLLELTAIDRTIPVFDAVEVAVAAVLSVDQS